MGINNKENCSVLVLADQVRSRDDISCVAVMIEAYLTMGSQDIKGFFFLLIDDELITGERRTV